MARARGTRAGGIRSLLELITQHGEALDADLQRDYHLSIADVVAGRVTLRRFASLVKGLPGDGTALWRANRRGMKPGVSLSATPPPADWWTPDRDLIASLHDRLADLLWIHTKDAADGKNRPRPIPRPGVRLDELESRVPAQSPEQLRAALRAHQQQNAHP
jgi:hypothetical protein